MHNFWQRLRNLTLEKFTRHLRNFFYKRAVLLVVLKKLDRLPNIQEPRLNVECRLLGPGDIQQISDLSNLDQEKIKRFFKNGSKCLAAFYNDKLIAYSWCHYKDYYFPFFHYFLKVHQGVYIGPNFVDPQFRGQRVHGFLLTRMFAILFEEGYKYIWGSVVSDNYSSIKGLISVGYTPQQQVEVIRIFKIIVYKNISAINQWYAVKTLNRKFTLWQKADIR
ncbi:MAG: GNAT family N-acetyltransferase [Syntrophomonadaceae bacterium]|jgi:hypothetical protein